MIFENDLKRGGDFFCRGAAADVQEVRWKCALGRAVLRDRVHGCHRQTSAVDHAADVSTQLDEGHVVALRFQFGRVFFVGIKHRRDVGMTKKRVVIKRHFTVECDDFVFDRHHQRVDL